MDRSRGHEPAGTAKRSRWRQAFATNPRGAAAVTGVVLLALTSIATGYTAHVAKKDAREHLERDADITVDAIQRRLIAYQEVLFAVKGLFEAEHNPSRARYRQFMRSLQVEARYPGVQAVGFADAIESFQLPALERDVRRDAPRSGSPYPRFFVHPPRVGAQQIPISYLEPVEGNEAAFGLDLLAEPRRRAAVERTQRTGQPSATAPLQLVQDPGENPAFLFMLAVRSVSGSLDSPLTGRFQGVVSAAVDANLLFGNILGQKAHAFELEVFDVGPVGGPSRPTTFTDPIYDLDGVVTGAGPDHGVNAVVRYLDVGGRRWLIHYETRAPASSQAPWIVAFAGTLVSLLGGFLVWTLARGRSRAVHLAEQMTRDLETSRKELIRTNSELRVSEQRVREIVDAASEAFISIDSAGKIIEWNPAAELTFGWTRAEALGRSLAETIIPERDQEAHRNGLLQFRETQEGRVLGSRVQVRARHRDGHEFPVEMAISVVRTEHAYTFNAFLHDITERKHEEDQLRHRANNDPLTGLANRSTFEDALALHIARARRHGPTGSLLVVDLDRFKDINDTHGHATGDAVLVATAKALRERLREADIIARLGGDEFAILLAEGSAEDARVVAQGLVARIADATAAETSLPVTASIGVAAMEDVEGLTAKAVTAAADRAMYEVKAAGRNGYKVLQHR